jgi:hypothetical protein
MKLPIISLIFILGACQAQPGKYQNNEIYGLKACQAFTVLYENTNDLIKQNKLSKDNITKFEKLRSVAQPYCLAGDFTEKATAEYVAGAVVDLILISKGK